MTLKRYVTEMGMGTDVHGGDYTKAARRAVSDAIRHSSLNFFRTLGKSPADMKITVRIGVQAPDQLDLEAIAAEFPYGEVTVVPVLGGLDVPEEPGRAGDPGIDKLVIANAAVLVCLED
ncbi:MAG: Lin0512 family protein [Pseudomonadales bacterium]